MRLLLISNSTNYGEEYLNYTRPQIMQFLGDSIREILFFPYAGVTLSFDEYEEKVAKVFNVLGYKVRSIHKEENPMDAVNHAKTIVVGGGNTFQLVHLMHKNGMMEAIRNKVKSGTPYIGWSAGSNLACPSLKTTNDMPITEPESFNTLNLIPFQINPHYTDYVQEGHGGETRDQRIAEFLCANQEMKVVGLREASMLLLEEHSLKLIGDKTMRLFQYNKDSVDYTSKDNLDFLMKK
jgi:dipeptidase E